MEWINFLFWCVCVFVREKSMCVCVFVRERERERERETERERERESSVQNGSKRQSEQGTGKIEAVNEGLEDDCAISPCFF